MIYERSTNCSWTFRTWYVFTFCAEGLMVVVQAALSTSGVFAVPDLGEWLLHLLIHVSCSPESAGLG